MAPQPYNPARLTPLEEGAFELARDALSTPHLQSLQLTVSEMALELTVETWHQGRVGGADDE